jgi:anti-sigma regulatory factor (Ser/Thr protein kinase)
MMKRDPDLKLELTSHPKFLAAARTMIGHAAQRIGFSPLQAGQVSLAVDEALCNIINHGYQRRTDGRIWLSLWELEDTREKADRGRPNEVEAAGRPGLMIVIEDLARQVDPSLIRSRDLDDIRPGGLGVHIIREVMDSVTYERREQQGMRLTMVKHLRPREGNDAAAAPGACEPGCCGSGEADGHSHQRAAGGPSPAAANPGTGRPGPSEAPKLPAAGPPGAGHPGVPGIPGVEIEPGRARVPAGRGVRRRSGGPHHHG